MLFFAVYLTPLSASNDWMIMNNDVEIMWREVVMA
jgi:hypothetical protein